MLLSQTILSALICLVYELLLGAMITTFTEKVFALTPFVSKHIILKFYVIYIHLDLLRFLTLLIKMQSVVYLASLFI